MMGVRCRRRMNRAGHSWEGPVVSTKIGFPGSQVLIHAFQPISKWMASNCFPGLRVESSAAGFLPRCRRTVSVRLSRLHVGGCTHDESSSIVINLSPAAGGYGTSPEL